MSRKPVPPHRWRRLFRGLLVTLVLGMLLTGAAGWWAYGRRVELLNKALALMPGPLSGTVAGLEIQRTGDFEVRDLRFRDRAGGAAVLHVPSATGRLDWTALRSRTVSQLTVHQPEVLLEEALISAWMQPGEPAARQGATPTPATFRLEKVDVRDAKVSIKRRDGLMTTLVVNYRSDLIALDESGHLTLGDEEVTVSKGDAGPDEKVLPYGLHRLHARGRMREGIVELDELVLDQPSVHLTPEIFEILGLHARPAATAPEARTAMTGAAPGRAPAAPVLRGVRIGKVSISGFAFAASGFVQGNAAGLVLPDVKVLADHYEGEDFEWRPGSSATLGRQTLHWQNVSIATPDGTGHIRCGDVQFALASWRVGGALKLESLFLRDPDVHWTPALRKLLVRGGSGPAVTAPSVPPAGLPAPVGGEPWSVTIASGGITGASVHLADSEVLDFELKVGGGFMLNQLRFDADGWHSAHFQSLELTRGQLAFPGGTTPAAARPFLELAGGELVVKPDDWNTQTRVAKLNLRKPLVRLREGNTPWVQSGPLPADAGTKRSGAEQPATDQAAKPESGETGRWWETLNFGQLAVEEGHVDLLFNAPKLVDLQARLEISTDRRSDGGSLHRVRVADVSTKLPTLSRLPFPVAEVITLEGAVRIPEMWQERHLEELRVTGANVEFGEAFMKLFEPDKTVSPPPPKAEELVLSGPSRPDGEPSRAWRAGHLSVQDSAVTIANLVPGLPSVRFGVSFDVRDTPLLAEDLVKDVAPQRIELHDLKVPSPHGTARYVAELDSIFVDFSLEGLMRKEIDGIEVVSPSLFVGEDLFWYVDFYRKYAEHGNQPAGNAPRMAANNDELDFEAARAAVEAEPPISQASWSVKRLQIHSGKLMLAPKGTPMQGIKEPFPFHLDTEVSRGTLNAELEVPKGTYELPDLNLSFVGTKGAVQFNLPIKQKDNNLVETFHTDSIRWKELKTGKAFLTMTYDARGIYARFGAEAYEGYINGEFNVYLDDSYHWDGWLGGKNLQTRELTQKLCPLYFLMDGRVDLMLVGQGSKDELYHADGSFKNQTPGRFSIRALNGPINDLPKEWDPLKAQLTKIGLESLRDFEYDRAEMKCRFYGREGNGTFQFSGPSGARKFDINVYDHRWRTDDDFPVTTAKDNDD